MADEAFQQGDVVEIKSGGPAMVVTGVGASVATRWWNGSTYLTHAFNAFELKRSSAPATI